MIGSGIRKFARERGLNCGEGYAYGELNGYHVFLDEGSGYKRLCVYLYPPVQNTVENEELCVRVRRALSDCDLKEYRLQRQDAIRVEAGFAQLIFHDKMGTMERIKRYVDEILPKLDGLSLDARRCACCGEALEGGARYAVLDGRVLPVHEGCMRELSDIVESVESEPRSGSVLLGALGALVGAVIGAIPWALVYTMGYVTSLVGFVIGALANFFYGKFGGKRSGARIVIVLLALVIGVGLGQAGGYTLEFSKTYDETVELAKSHEEIDAEDPGMSRGEFVRMAWEQYLLYDQEKALGLEYDRALAKLAPEERVDLLTREEFVDLYYAAEVDEMRTQLRGAFLKDCGVGLFFGLLGCLGVFQRVYHENKRRKVKELN